MITWERIVSRDRIEELPLADATKQLLEECRMVLPGVQALFGFQLIAVYSEGFAQKLSTMEQRLHLLALGLVAIAVALVMAPAAFHRLTGPMKVSRTFVTVASRLLLWAMVPLMFAIGLDFYLIARVILEDKLVSLILVLVLLIIFTWLWFLLPRLAFLQRLVRGRQ
jgi:hypothetical protein